MSTPQRPSPNPIERWDFRKQLPGMWAFLLAVIHRRYTHALAADAADDLIQEALTRAWKQHDGFHGRSDGELRAWLRGILRRVVADLLRHHHPSAPVPEATAAETPGPEEEAAAHEELAFLQAALEQLPPEDRHLLSPEMQALSLA